MVLWHCMLLPINTLLLSCIQLPLVSYDMLDLPMPALPSLTSSLPLLRVLLYHLAFMSTLLITMRFVSLLKLKGKSLIIIYHQHPVLRRRSFLTSWCLLHLPIIVTAFVSILYVVGWIGMLLSPYQIRIKSRWYASFATWPIGLRPKWAPLLKCSSPIMTSCLAFYTSYWLKT